MKGIWAVCVSRVGSKFHSSSESARSKLCGWLTEMTREKEVKKAGSMASRAEGD